MQFTHLHTHSHYSLLDGLGKIDQIIARVKELGMDSVALTDHGNLYGAIEFYQKAKKAGIKPIIGCEMYVAADGMHNKRPGVDDKRFHLTVLSLNQEGYQNLITLVTEAHLRGFYYKSRVDHDLLRQHAKGLVALSGCLGGEIPRAIANKKLDEAERLVRMYQEIFGAENFYLELGAHTNYPEQKVVNDALFSLGAKTGAPLVVTGDIHYIKSEDREAQDILVSVQTGNVVKDENRLTMKELDLSIQSGDQMALLFPNNPEVVINAQKIADRVDLEIELGANKLPLFSVPDGQTENSYLRSLCEQGVVRRYGAIVEERHNDAEVQERLDYELRVIQETGFASYFLITQDFVAWAKEQGIVVGPGRGSAAGSLVSYLLGITNIDPLKYNLLFERFLNPERISMPDIDLDFADARRDEVIEYVAQKYGRDHVAQIITFGTMAARAAIRDTGRALGLPYGFCDKMAKMIPFNPTQGMKVGWLQKCLDTVQELKDAYNQDPDAKRLIDAALKLEGVARHASTHACGVVISPNPLHEYVPLQYATRGGGSKSKKNTNEENQVVVTQYEMHAVEDLGLLKMDFLGLRNLTIIEHSLRLIEQLHDITIDMDTIPLDDASTFALFQRGETTGCFQFESDGMKRYLKELKPTELEDLIAMVALYRPGPIELIPSYIKRKHGEEQATYLHPRLEPILRNTHGIGLYQEQMMQIARDLAGYTLPEADTLRKAIGKKIKSLLDEQREKLTAGMIQNGIEERVARSIWELFPPFARYGFNRSHAACYALIAYQTGYLKAQYPTEFVVSLLTAEGSDVERIAFVVEEARSMGIEVLGPDVNESFDQFTVVEAKKIRFGLESVKNVGANVVAAIVAARKQGGKFSSITEFIERVEHKDLNKKSLEALVKCGALDALGERNQLLANMDMLLEFSRETQRARAAGQASLFGALPDVQLSALRLREAEPAPKRERLGWEKELLGLYVSEHPMEDFVTAFQERKALPLKDVLASKRKGPISTGGLVSSVQKIITKKGDPMLFVKMEDMTARTEVLVFPRVLAENPDVWQTEKVLFVRGRISDKDGTPKILCEEAVEVTV